jgi:hypothetical protein
VSQIPTLHIDDATEHLVGYLRDEITKPPPHMPIFDNKYGCDLWVPIVVANFWQSRGHPTVSADPRQPQNASYYRPFYDAVWQLCRIGVLRPGETAPMGNSTHGRGLTGDGFSLTDFGRGWVQTAAQHSPSDPSRFSEMLQPFISRFGEGFAQRAAEASRCYQTANYLACCVMAGAAGEIHFARNRHCKDGWRRTKGAGRISQVSWSAERHRRDQEGTAARTARAI